jgi:acyl carrier protein
MLEETAVPQIIDETELEARIRQIITDELELEPEELTLDADFMDDYDADSLSLITVVARIDRELGIHLPEEVQLSVQTLDDLLAAARSHAGAGEHV